MTLAATRAEVKLPNGPICGVVVTYFPTEGIEHRLTMIAKQVDALVVVDNSVSHSITSRLTTTIAQIGAHLISNSENLGVATALNQGVAFARATAAARVAFFDQDSEPADGFRNEIDNAWSSYNHAAPLGILGCNYVQAGGATARFSTLHEKSQNYVLVDSVITSGSVYEIAMLSRLGPFRDEFFIDGVDTEYCWRALIGGYGVGRTTAPVLSHILGNPTRHIFLGHEWGTSNHPAFRRYFMARNSVLILWKYSSRLPRLSLCLMSVQLKGAILLIAFESEKRRKLGFLLLGLWHGLLQKTDVKPWQFAKQKPYREPRAEL